MTWILTDIPIAPTEGFDPDPRFTSFAADREVRDEGLPEGVTKPETAQVQRAPTSDE